jgi:hypothetical protein
MKPCLPPLLRRGPLCRIREFCNDDASEVAGG